DVLDLQRSHHRTAPLVFGVTGDFRRRGRNATGAEDVVGSVHEVRHARNLEQTPSLVDADVTDDVRNMRAAVSIRTGRSTTGGARESATWNCRDASREVEQRSTVEHGRIIKADGGRHTVAELRGVLDVVHAGDVISAAEQERVVVARIAVPR